MQNKIDKINKRLDLINKVFNFVSNNDEKNFVFKILVILLKHLNM